MGRWYITLHSALLFYVLQTIHRYSDTQIPNTEYRIPEMSSNQQKQNNSKARVDDTLRNRTLVPPSKTTQKRDINLSKLETFSSSKLNPPAIWSVFTTLRRANILKLRRRIGSSWRRDWKNIRISTPRLEELRIIGVVNRLSCRVLGAGVKHLAFGVSKMRMLNALLYWARCTSNRSWFHAFNSYNCKNSFIYTPYSPFKGIVVGYFLCWSISCDLIVVQQTSPVSIPIFCNNKWGITH
jgi:hypothetical protein